jgi:very-short-patch-repair endonuclease
MDSPRYRSGLEKRVGEILKAHQIPFKHEFEVLKYTKPEQISRYSVDFFIPKAKKLIVESKGRFTSEDRKKMLLIKDQYR